MLKSKRILEKKTFYNEWETFVCQIKNVIGGRGRIKIGVEYEENMGMLVC